ncbi:MAG: Glycosyl transferase group 1 [Candidatus Nomurabacteria bacterium GW2011_GWB1_37_5]|uniref:Glycosyl transferase group 1 n=1 Tax=Candidatus Nomurabacteria bacterium GW2011_GWB1_37_5 TaxID=1618742 RepID=A0A0G0GYP4_9BACT|nr:MAG: Glycosyl transferase group 1 [Candidatus Nomurabacteria bacterium GW2011_GWB1_37_5]
MTRVYQYIMKKRILVITQCFACGSWLSIEKITNILSDNKHALKILGYGSLHVKRSDQIYSIIPFIAYNRYGYLTCYGPMFVFLWNIPIFIVSLFQILLFRPNVIIYNGFGLGLILSPVSKIFGIKNIIMYHSTIRDVGIKTKNILKKLINYVDMIVVNSEGSRMDIIDVTPNNKIVTNHHFASDIFFNNKKRSPKPHDNLNILYVGRIDKDKLCFPLIDFAKKTKSSNKFHFTFVGAGSEVNHITHLAKIFNNIDYLGYISDTCHLSKLYREADVLWTFADTTYLALPAIEALASGTPIIVPEYAAITGRKEKINRKLVPTEIGWSIDPYNEEKVSQLLERIRSGREYRNKKCKEYAEKFYQLLPYSHWSALFQRNE